VISKIPVCARIGLVSGFFSGLVAIASVDTSFLTDSGVAMPMPLASGLPYSILGGIIAALIFALITALFHVLLFRYPPSPLLIVAVIVAIPVGLIAGLLPEEIATPWIAALTGAILGFIVGWLICWLLCGTDKVSVNVEGYHVKR
jgi:hypothetical protein